MRDKTSRDENRLTALRAAMKAHGVQGFLVPRADEFQGEFVAPYAERLKWLTGFTGSAGLALILEERAAVLTDARYTLQIARQIDTHLYEALNIADITAGQWLADYTPEGAAIGYDPWLHTPAQIEKLEKETAARGLVFKPVEYNPLDAIRADRPALPKGPVSVFPQEIAGLSSKDKRIQIGRGIEAEGGACAVISLPDSLCWLLNVRGADTDYTPSVLSYGLIRAGDGVLQWFIDPDKLTPAVRAHLGNDVHIVDIADMQESLDKAARYAAQAGKPVFLDYDRTPVWFKRVLEEAGALVKNRKDPCIAPKAIKTPAEQRAVREAHIRDGAALTRFLCWLEEAAPQGGLDEWKVVQKLYNFRAESNVFKGESFPAIVGFGENGAIVHYRATADNHAPIVQPGLLLVDSGGQYPDGTTDITRTVALGEPSQEMKENFTRVLRGHIAVASARFKAGTIGADIDALARAPLREAGLDYAHGTGHGVGCYLAVHEEAASLSPRGADPLEPGMLLSNEPGYYKEGAYGIRIENLVLVQAGRAGMLEFETVSLAPIDPALIVPAMMSVEELAWLDSYHAEVRERLAALLSEKERFWLARKTRPLGL